MTLEKLAKAAGVSISTASKAMSGNSEISEFTRRKVFDVAKQNGCFEKYYKPKYEKHIIAVICPELNSLFYSSIVTSLGTEISKRGAEMVLSVSNFSAKITSDLIRYYSNFAHASAVIVIGYLPKIKPLPDIPIVTFGSCEQSSGADCITTNIQSAINDAVAYLKRCGHRQISFIGEKLTSSKFDGFIDAMHNNCLSVKDEYILISDERFERAGYQCMDTLLTLRDRPTAIIAGYDNIAIGAIMRMRECGCSVPDDFSIIGMDDISTAPYMSIPLTSIRLHVDELCGIALDLIFKKIENKFFNVKQKIEIQSSLIIRDSVKAIN